MKPGQAVAWLRRHRIATLVPAAGELPSLVATIAGGPISGSWWSHPTGKEIFAAASALEDAGDEVVVVKLVQAKVTYVHAALWPPLIAIVEDAQWRRRASKDLDPEARVLLAEVIRQGEIDLESHAKATGVPVKTLSRPRKVLEDRLLVLGRSVHTKSGRHAMILSSWQCWAEERKIKRFAGSLDDAMTALTEAAGGVKLGIDR